MHVCVCMYVYMYVCIHVCMYVYMYLCMYGCMYDKIRMYVFTLFFICVRMDMNAYLFMQSLCYLLEELVTSNITTDQTASTTEKNGRKGAVTKC